jgi:hypothetical protein
MYYWLLAGVRNDKIKVSKHKDKEEEAVKGEYGNAQMSVQRNSCSGRTD